MIEPWIQTYTGIKFTFLNPSLELINIKDIAYSLSRTCRFNGHCIINYPVTEHSIIVSQMSPPKHALWGLLHDAAESYIGDIPTPLKKFCPKLKEIELNILRVIANKYNLEWPMPQVIHDIDRKLLVTEQKLIMKDPPEQWPGLENIEPYDIKIKEKQGKESFFRFLERFKELTNDKSI